MMGNHGGAILNFNRAIEIDENFAHAYGNRGTVKSDLGNYEGALIDLNKALGIEPNFARGYRVRVITYHRQGNTTYMCADLKKASALYDKDAITILQENPGCT